MNKFQFLSEAINASSKLSFGPLCISVLKMLAENPELSRKDIKQWATTSGFDIEEVETRIYKIAAAFARFWFGGLSNKKSFTERDADAEQLRMGIEVEYEHTPDFIASKKIALDHLAEIPDYYTRLDKMEKEAGVDKH